MNAVVIIVATGEVECKMYFCDVSMTFKLLGL